MPDAPTPPPGEPSPGGALVAVADGNLHLFCKDGAELVIRTVRDERARRTVWIDPKGRVGGDASLAASDVDDASGGAKAVPPIDPALAGDVFR